MQGTLALELVAKWDATMVVDALTEYGIQNVIVQRLVSKDIDAKIVRQSLKLVSIYCGYVHTAYRMHFRVVENSCVLFTRSHANRTKI